MNVSLLMRTTTHDGSQFAGYRQSLDRTDYQEASHRYLNSVNTLRCCQSGMTLVELMIAMLIGAFLLGGVIQIFLSTKQSYRMAEGLSRLQENGRYALEILNNDFRMSGYQGCRSVNEVTPTNSASAPIIALTSADVVMAYQGDTAATPTNVWSPALSATLSGLTTPVAPGTDVITVLYGSSCGGYLSSDMASTSDDISIPAANTCGINTGDTDALLISDCSSAEIFRTTSTSTSTVIKHSALSKAYTTSAELFAYRAYSYFIRPGASGEPALWRLDNSEVSNTASNPMELIEGIENMQILYGEDTDATPDGTPNYYVTADNIVNMANVVSIRISLLAQTIDDNLTKQPQPYTYSGVTTTPTDRRIRRVFNSTIAVRNRLL